MALKGPATNETGARGAPPVLGELTTLIRSKNAGPFVLTIDIVFRSGEAYELARRAGIITEASLAALYGADPRLIRIFWHDRLHALKVTMPRRTPAGSPDDWDTFGCQWHAPLVKLPVTAAAPREGRPTS